MVATAVGRSGTVAEINDNSFVEMLREIVVGTELENKTMLTTVRITIGTPDDANDQQIQFNTECPADVVMQNSIAFAQGFIAYKAPEEAPTPSRYQGPEDGE
jgi:hypothetical protein